jgi:hypothetical protein
MAAGKLNITIEQGATFSRTITLTDENGNAIDLTDATARGQIRPDFNSDTKYDFTLTVTSEEDGTIDWVMSDTITSSIDTTANNKWVYDVEVVYADDTVERILQGTATISPEVTR